MIIGICDDVCGERETLHKLCEKYFQKVDVKHEYKMFSSGEEILEFCEKQDSVRLDLLFLDVEMGGISGIDVKNAVLNQKKVWRIVYVSSHTESMMDAYGIKTIGFIPKPVTDERIEKMMTIMMDDLKKDITFQISGPHGEMMEIKLEDILFFRADGSYTEIYTYKSLRTNQRYVLSTKKLGVIEKELEEYEFFRVHKSYLINLMNTINVGTTVAFQYCGESVPVGRKYKEEARRSFLEFGRNVMRKRL
ncbi:MAG: LytTR family DNA-binding domain-containing protein [Lachnospira sp.]|nr:LytTR family DNA-binding domain-containing protein [Lachnospira sp.]